VATYELHPMLSSAQGTVKLLSEGALSCKAMRLAKGLKAARSLVSSPN
jgi:hypothetical protein